MSSHVAATKLLANGSYAELATLIDETGFTPYWADYPYHTKCYWAWVEESVVQTEEEVDAQTDASWMYDDADAAESNSSWMYEDGGP